MSKELVRNAELIPKSMQIIFRKNSLSICYSIQDTITNAKMGEVYVNFNPSKKLMRLLSEETTKAIIKNDRD